MSVDFFLKNGSVFSFLNFFVGRPIAVVCAPLGRPRFLVVFIGQLNVVKSASSSAVGKSTESTNRVVVLTISTLDKTTGGAAESITGEDGKTSAETLSSLVETIEA